MKVDAPHVSRDVGALRSGSDSRFQSAGRWPRARVGAIAALRPALFASSNTDTNRLTRGGIRRPEPTPVFWGRLRCAAVAGSLRSRRSWVRIPPGVPSKPFRYIDLRPFDDLSLQARPTVIGKHLQAARSSTRPSVRRRRSHSAATSGKDRTPAWWVGRPPSCRLDCMLA